MKKLGFGNMFYAALLASTVPAVLFIVLNQVRSPFNAWVFIGAPAVYSLSLCLTLIIGIPCALLLNIFNCLDWRSILVVGFIIAIALVIPLNIALSPAGGDYISVSCSVILGVVTTATYLLILKRKIA